MTVAQLIELLGGLPPTSFVVLETANGYNHGAVTGLDASEVRAATSFRTDAGLSYLEGAYYTGHPAQHRDEDSPPVSVVVIAKVWR